MNSDPWPHLSQERQTARMKVSRWAWIARANGHAALRRAVLAVRPGGAQHLCYPAASKRLERSLIVEAGILGKHERDDRPRILVKEVMEVPQARERSGRPELPGRVQIAATTIGHADEATIVPCFRDSLAGDAE